VGIVHDGGHYPTGGHQWNGRWAVCVEICRGYRGILMVLTVAGCAGLEDARGPVPSTSVTDLPAASGFMGPLEMGGSRGVPGTEVCRGTLEGPVVTDVTVPRGAECRLDEISVRGKIHALPGGALELRGVWVGGSILAADAREIRILRETLVEEGVVVRRGAIVLLEASTVSGNLRVEGAGTRLMVLGSRVDGEVHARDTDGTFLLDTRVAGRATLEENRGPIWLERNDLRGNVFVLANVGGVDLRSNRIAGRLYCQGNDPGPRGLENTVGREEAQCGPLVPYSLHLPELLPRDHPARVSAPPRWNLRGEARAHGRKSRGHLRRSWRVG
jgi:hypothetical protein